MEQTQRSVGGANYGIPRLVGKLFRATRIPSVLLLLWIVGVPLAARTYLTVYKMRYHSRLPADIFLGGILQLKSQLDPNGMNVASAELVHLMDSLTPEQRQQGATEFEWFAFLCFVAGLVFLWWLARVILFVARKEWSTQP